MHSALIFLVQVEEYMLPCFSKQYLGVDCFGCGIQRSLALISRGEFIEAFKMYPAIYTLILFFIFVGINIFFKFKGSQKLVNILGIANVVIIIISFIVKKLSYI
ncbi:DUF2752 domain-containing protein [Kordia jejudonensis]|uniref:DUF2752 domain-containing protein n=1 Tax=Kordia jejudonensis TaxID=1348245 RepID=UPI0006291D00|nr:DUF2752 domain-containing protein [Kordia jejudonensis]